MEFALAASILQVAGAGVKLSKTLYDFGSTASSAGEQTDFIARNVTLYSGVLQTLGQRLQDDASVHSTDALDLAKELQEQSDYVFERIRELLRGSTGNGETLSFMQKIKWAFRKGRVDYLVAQLEYLKSTVSLLVQILYTGQVLQ